MKSIKLEEYYPESVWGAPVCKHVKCWPSGVSGGQLPSLEPRKLIMKINKIYPKYGNGFYIILKPHFMHELCEM